MRVLRFDGGSADIARREVRLHGRVQHLEPQAFDVLVYLLEHRDRFVPNHERLDQVWSNQFVSESALTIRPTCRPLALGAGRIGAALSSWTAAERAEFARLVTGFKNRS